MQESQQLAGQISHIRETIDAFLADRLTARLNKLSADDPKRVELIAKFERSAWIGDAANRVRQIQAVTHSLKAIHPDARGTNLYVNPASMPPLDVVGSHVLPAGFASDVVGNAAALDVYKFLRLEVEGRNLLDRLLTGDPAATAALSDDKDQAETWRLAFIGLIRDSERDLVSHTLGKQTYWFIGEDPADDVQYHLLAPLFATSLAQVVHDVLHEDRYGEANKVARAARRSHQEREGVLRDYPALAVRKLGGINAQNVSQMNAQRGGINYLLGSLPPRWDKSVPRNLWGVASVFGPVLMAQGDVRVVVRNLLRFLRKDPAPNMETRNRVDSYVDSLIDEVVAMAGGFHRTLPKGWTADPRCKLTPEERLWLDPLRAEDKGVFRRDWLCMDWPAQIGSRFANWLNARLKTYFPSVGDIEHRRWKRELLVDEDLSGWTQQLHGLRVRLDAPRYIPTRGGRI